MTDLAERLHAIRAHLQTGALGQREVWEEWLTEAGSEIARLRKDKIAWQDVAAQYAAEIERLTAALQMIIDDTYDEWAKTIARRALEPKP